MADTKDKNKKSSFFDYVRSFGLAILVALAIRAFFFEAFKIPSSSMVPSLMIGDHLFVNKLVYGLRVPFTNTYIKEFRDPKRGEVVVFINPVDNELNFIKRVIGLPGDVVEVNGHSVTVNGATLERIPLNITEQSDPYSFKVENSKWQAHLSKFHQWSYYQFFSERVNDVIHPIQYRNGAEREGGRYQVPPGHFFVMGDNRDDSSDSRVWGFVPRDHIRGKAMFIWLSWDSFFTRIRWERFGQGIN